MPYSPTHIAVLVALVLMVTTPNVVTTPGGTGNHSAADLLATGQPGRAVIVEFQPLGKRNPAGIDLYAYVLTVMPDGRDPTRSG